MSKLTTAVASFVRDAFGRDQKAREELSVAGRQTMGGMGINSPGMDSHGLGDVSEALGLDRRLLHRFGDYEQMDEYGDINSALDIYADDATQIDSERRKSVWIDCQNEKIKTDLEDMFYKRLQIEENIWEIARQTCKYGNDYEEILVGSDGVIGLNFLPPATVRRIQRGSSLLGFVQSYSQDMQIDPKTFEKMKLDQGAAMSERRDSAVFEDWRVVHFRLRSKHRNSTYGWSVTDSARHSWKRLMLLEDSVMVYKLTRSPSRYAFYVDVGNLPNKEAERKLQEVKARMKKRKFVNPKTGKLDFRFNPLAFDEDFFLGVRDGKESTRIDVLNGPSYQQIEDVQYFLYKLYAALKVPRAYLGYDENMPSKATLSQEDVRFARTVLRIQRELMNGLHKVGRVHLASRMVDPASVDFNICMTVPSSIFELGQMEVRRTRAEIASSMERHVSLYWMLSNIYGMSDDEIENVMKQKDDEMKKAQAAGGVGMESILWPGQASRSIITEKELFEGNREHEKRMEEMVKKEIEKMQTPFARQLRETQLLIQDIASSVRRVA